MTEKKMNKAQRLEAAQAECERIFDEVPDASQALVANKLADKFELEHTEARRIVWAPYYGAHLEF